MEIAEYTATQIKQAVVGTGAANKEQVQMMVMHMLKLTSKPQIDASDALAIAICHAHTRIQADQLTKEVTIALANETIEQLRIFAHHQMGVQRNRLADRR